MSAIAKPIDVDVQPDGDMVALIIVGIGTLKMPPDASEALAKLHMKASAAARKNAKGARILRL